MRYHVMWGTYGSWLPGDPRGFRTRKHRLHVPWDYRHPPPAGAYDGLYARAQQSLKKPPVALPACLRETVGRACLERFGLEGVEVFALSVGSQHVHAALGCPGEGLKERVGRAKKVSSHRVRNRLPGRVWQEGCRPIPVRDEAHWRNVLDYIASHAPGAWVWVRGDP
jgi:hypothetical protein